MAICHKIYIEGIDPCEQCKEGLLVGHGYTYDCEDDACERYRCPDYWSNCQLYNNEGYGHEIERGIWVELCLQYFDCLIRAREEKIRSRVKF